jgi:hypothetical protein
VPVGLICLRIGSSGVCFNAGLNFLVHKRRMIWLDECRLISVRSVIRGAGHSAVAGKQFCF